MNTDFTTLLLRSGGRIGRKDFWIGAAAVTLCGVVLSIFPVAGSVASLGLLWPSYCLVSKRLRDVGRDSGLALIVMIPLALAAILAALSSLVMISPQSTVGLWLVLLALAPFSLAGVVLAIAIIIWVGITPAKVPAGNFDRAI